MLPSETSSQIQQAMKDGKLSPISTILLVLREELLHITSSVLLDGFPHSLEQLEEFEKVVGDKSTPYMLGC